MNNRRSFLKSLGLSMGIAVSSNPLSSLAQESNSKVHRVGVLLASSLTHPEYTESFIRGIQLAFYQVSNDNLRFEPITEIVKFGYPSQAIKRTQSLLAHNRIDSLIGLLNNDVADRISELTQAAKVPIIVSNAGENLPTNTMRNNPNLFFSSLDLCRNSALSGKLMVNKFGKKISLVSDIHDCGYDTIYSFQTAVEQAGGEIINKFINDRTDAGFNYHTINKLAAEKSDALFLLMNKQGALDFLKTLHASALNIPIVTTSFVCEESITVHLGNAADNLYHVSSWIKEIKNENNKRFVRAYNQQFSSAPDQFSFLGYQTGLLITDIKRNDPGDLTNKNKQLKNSPSDHSFINMLNRRVDNAAYLCKTVGSNYSSPTNVVIEQLDTTENFEGILGKNVEDIHSGWLNPYLFA